MQGFFSLGLMFTGLMECTFFHCRFPRQTSFDGCFCRVGKRRDGRANDSISSFMINFGNPILYQDASMAIQYNMVGFILPTKRLYFISGQTDFSYFKRRFNERFKWALIRSLVMVNFHERRLVLIYGFFVPFSRTAQ